MSERKESVLRKNTAGSNFLTNECEWNSVLQSRNCRPLASAFLLKNGQLNAYWPPSRRSTTLTLNNLHLLETQLTVLHILENAVDVQNIILWDSALN